MIILFVCNWNARVGLYLGGYHHWLTSRKLKILFYAHAEIVVSDPDRLGPSVYALPFVNPILYRLLLLAVTQWKKQS